MEAFDNWERWGDTEEERNMERTGTTPNETKKHKHKTKHTQKSTRRGGVPAQPRLNNNPPE